MGQPDNMEKYLQKGKTLEGCWGERDVVADIIGKSASHLKKETILHYMRKAESHAYEVPDHRDEVHRSDVHSIVISDLLDSGGWNRILRVRLLDPATRRPRPDPTKYNLTHPFRLPLPCVTVNI